MKFKRIIWLFAISAFLVPTFSYAASLEIISEGTSRSIGEFYTATAIVDPAGADINAVTGSITYDRTKLSFKSIDVNSSVVSFWVVKPLEIDGKINFEGVILSGGSASAKAELFKMIFETKSPGTANVAYSSGSVLNDDGKATNILSKFVNSSIVIKNKAIALNPVSPDIAPQTSPTITLVETPTFFEDNLAIIEYPSRVGPKERVVIRGRGSSRETVSVVMAINRPKSLGERILRVLKNDQAVISAIAKTDDTGNFTHTFNQSLVAGVYNAWLERPNALEGEERSVSDQVNIEVKEGAFYKIWIIIVNSLLLIIPIALLGIVIFTVWWRGKRELKAAEDFLHNKNKSEKQS